MTDLPLVAKRLAIEKVLILPNIVSSLRVFLLPFFVLLAKEFVKQPQNPVLYFSTIVVFLIALSTDFLDGFLARKLKEETVLGKYLDPVCDKFLTIVALCLINKYFQFPTWILLLIIIREILGSLLGTYLFFKKHFQGEPNFSGKLGVVLVALNVILFLTETFLRIDLYYLKEFFSITVFLTYLFGSIQYIRKYL
ncbi:MAG: CDP-alcohol phosphatidyltransferase family protein [Leptospiraceae bacterium]|nr:CDP-alcohol phosphatidyltransferase family protein [Leptospiraceae bacterium]